MWLQVLVTLIVAVVLVRLVQTIRAKRMRLTSGLLWMLLWIGVAVVFWSPDLVSRLAFAVHIGRGADLVIYSAIIVLCHLLYRIFVRLEKMERDITTITREFALRHDRKEKDGSRFDR